MENSNRSIIIGTLIGLAAVAGVVALILWAINSHFKRLSASAPVEIINASPVSWKEGNKTLSGYVISYRFTANGKVFSAEDRNRYYRPGTKAHVCHDPKNPSVHQFVVSDDDNCGGGVRYKK